MDNSTELFSIVGAGLVGLVVLGTLVFTFFIVQQRTIAMVQRRGKIVRAAGPGLRIKVPFVERVVGRLSLNVQELDVRIDTKARDGGLVSMVVAVQYCVLPEKAYEAFHQVEVAPKEISSLVFDVVRSLVAEVVGNELFERKDEIAGVVKQELTRPLEGFGYDVLSVRVANIDLDPQAEAVGNENTEGEGPRQARKVVSLRN